MKKLLLSFSIILCSIHNIVYAQVTIAPTNLFIESNTKFGSYMVINGSNQTQEVSVEFFFGYVDTDDIGNRILVNDDSLRAEIHSIDNYVRAFPRNFTLAPGQRQAVRLRISAPNDIPEGTYWARIKTASAPEAPPLELQAEDIVSARVGITIEQVTGLFYKQGNVSTGIEIDNISYTKFDDNNILSIMTDYKRTGNSPFFGTVTTTLYDENGTTVANSFVSTSIYFDGIHRQDFDLSEIPNGDYTVRVTFESRRNDISASDLIQIPNVVESTTINIR